MSIYKEYEKIIDCEEDGFHSGHVCECCLGKRKTHKGYIWEYK
jgi:hypothetical protein